MAKLSLTGIAVFALLTAACGGSPTSPTTVDIRAAANPAAGANDPTPAPPAPTPTPPAPAPGPAAPEPPGDTVETWSATVDVQRAAPGNELPATFTVTVRGDQMQFGPLEVTILARDGRHIYARKGTALTIEIDDEKWTVTSVEVFATGTISYTPE
jgi:hypothetical protein